MAWHGMALPWPDFSWYGLSWRKKRKTTRQRTKVHNRNNNKKKKKNRNSREMWKTRKKREKINKMKKKKKRGMIGIREETTDVVENDETERGKEETMKGTCLSDSRAPVADFGPNLAVWGHVWPTPDQCWPNLANTGPNLAKSGKHRPKLRRIQQPAREDCLKHVPGGIARVIWGYLRGV